MAAVEARDFFGRNDVLVLVAPGEYDEGGVGADRTCGQQPPDMPDQGETHEGREERADEAGRRIAWNLDRLIFRLVVWPCLFSRDEWDLRPVLRGGEDDERVARFLADATWTKQAGHGISSAGFVQPERTMSAIGG